jgi:hypothetical protein
VARVADGKRLLGTIRFSTSQTSGSRRLLTNGATSVDLSSDVVTVRSLSASADAGFAGNVFMGMCDVVHLSRY